MCVCVCVCRYVCFVQFIQHTLGLLSATAQRPIKSRYFERKFLDNPKKLLRYLTPQNFVVIDHTNNDLFQFFNDIFSLSHIKLNLFHKNIFFEIMILSIGGAAYSYRYRLQPIVLLIGPII